METMTIQKFIHTTPRKLRLVADMVRILEPNKALLTLQFTRKAAANELLQALKVALGNARNLGMDTNQLFFKKIEINEGPKMKRIRAASKGRARPYKKRMSHIKIVLSDEEKK